MRLADAAANRSWLCKRAGTTAGQRCGFAGGDELRGSDHEQLFRAELAHDEVRAIRRIDGDGDVEAFRDEIADGLRDDGFEQHFRMALNEAREERSGVELGERMRDRHPQRTAGRGVAIGELALGFVQLGEGGVSPGVERFALRRETKAAGAALEEAHVELLLELPHVAREGGLRRTERAAGRGEATVGDHGEKAAERVQIHVGVLFHIRDSAYRWRRLPPQAERSRLSPWLTDSRS